MSDLTVLAQLSRGYRYNSDSLILADFALKQGIKGVVFDVGAGCAIKKEITKVIKKIIFIIITPQKMVSTARFELTASKLGILRSILLSYEDAKRENSAKKFNRFFF